MVKFIRGMVEKYEKELYCFIYSIVCCIIAGGMALKNIFEYSMIIGVGLATIFLLVAASSLGKKNRGNSSHN